jgi:hypothetical protein
MAPDGRNRGDTRIEDLIRFQFYGDLLVMSAVIDSRLTLLQFGLRLNNAAMVAGVVAASLDAAEPAIVDEEPGFQGRGPHGNGKR